MAVDAIHGLIVHTISMIESMLIMKVRGGEKTMTANQNAYFLSEESIKNYYEYFLMEKEKSWDIFVLINRKGYWDYKIFFPNLSRNKYGQRLIVSDRFIDKYPLTELKIFLRGKRVIVYDDSLTNGSNLFYYYSLCRIYGAKSVKPVVYALNAEFPTEHARKLMKREAGRIIEEKAQSFVDNMIDDFIEELECKVILGTQDVDIMSMWQTTLFQKNLSPLVMDLPMLNHEKNSSRKKITLSKEQFDKLRYNIDEKWKFVDNEMKCVGTSVKASYFRFDCELLNDKFSDFFHDFVVKCKYNIKDENVDLVFTPFAIVKSITFEEVFFYFNLFYENTLYGKEILKYFPENKFSPIPMEKDPNLCKAMFRAVIFSISDYIGRNFQSYVEQVLDIKLEYDWDIMTDNFDDFFIETQREIYKSYDVIKLRNLFYNNLRKTKIPPLMKKEYQGAGKVFGTQERINNFVRRRISDKKGNYGITLSERIYTIETLESEVDDRFFFHTDLEKRECITNVCLLFLETNSFGNMLHVDAEKNIIYRSFRYGENSEIFLHENLWLFYAYLYAYYYEYGSEKIVNNYDYLMERVEEYFDKQGYWEIWMTKDSFYFLRDYFKEKEQEQLVKEIQRRDYLVKNMNDEEAMIRKRLINEAVNIVRIWGEA